MEQENPKIIAVASPGPSPASSGPAPGEAGLWLARGIIELAEMLRGGRGGDAEGGGRGEAAERGYSAGDVERLLSQAVARCVDVKPRPRMLATGEAAEFLGVAKGTLEEWRSAGRGPRFSKIGRSVRYHPDDLARFAGEQARQSTSQMRNAECGMRDKAGGAARGPREKQTGR